ncbi:hypothetical protein BaOVIS_022190 [Babesia ovis]|uniref:Uncharacterized protein n=1 Tax=Babesia ovis TaxID=5869 RepID=A0A9W5TC78_BABOV|nr:hypothetical protein BaOVIS_022190 [Babesia ovis]
MASLHGLRVPTNLNNSDFSFATGIKKPTATAEQLDSLYFREKEAPKHGNLDLGDVAYELCQLDASLDELFREAQAHFSTHQQIHKFRLRVSRRISAFAAICRKLFKQIEIASSPDALRLRSLHRFYMDRLMRDEDEDTGCDSLLDNVGEDESELVLKLKATRNMMLNQIKQMNAAESSMLKSSNYIIRQDEILDGL